MIKNTPKSTKLDSPTTLYLVKLNLTYSKVTNEVFGGVFLDLRKDALTFFDELYFQLNVSVVMM